STAPVQTTSRTVPVPESVPSVTVASRPVSQSSPAPVQNSPRTVVVPDSVPSVVVPARPVAMKTAPAPQVAAAPAPASPRMLPAPVPAAPMPAPPAAAPSPGVAMLLGILHNSVNPFQREWAVESLAATEWRSNPEVVPALVQAAREDA